MKQSQKQQKLKGSEGFGSYYGDVFGKRWPALKESLEKEGNHAAFSHEGCLPYYLDPASICAPLCLPLPDAGHILDLCAAPGGKTLVLAAAMSEKSTLTSNERSPDRTQRLSKVVQESLPSDIQKRLNVTNSDGATLCRRETEVYDAILLDAPCSSERHVLNDAKYLSQWSPARIKNIAVEQWALLSSAWRLLAPEGFLVYATCALSPRENDGIIERLLKKFPDALLPGESFTRDTFEKNLSSLRKSFSVNLEGADTLESVFGKAERTQFGHHVLPDTSGGYGPLYFALAQKSREKIF
ncbi:MAG TPA: RNA methyltransferase [Treponema sp.]|nr:RNA methyltransferase [Treponema sp.]